MRVTESPDQAEDSSERSRFPGAAADRTREISNPEVADDRVTRELRGFGPLGIAAILFILLILLIGSNPLVPLGAILVLIWARLSRTPWRQIGYAWPRSWTRSLVIGVAFGAAFKFLMKAIVMPLLGADPINHAFHYLAGNRAALPAAIWMMIVVAGFGEETVFRGYLFERLGKLLRSRVLARPMIVLLTAVLFGLAHYSNQGLAGAEQATIVGACLRSDLRAHAPDLDADARACGVRPDRPGDDLF